MRVVEVLPLLFASPLYVAVIEWVSADKPEVANVATLSLSATVPSATGRTLHGASEQVNSEKVTVPVAAGDTVAVKVTI